MTTSKIENVEDLKEHLYLAMQLEHATIPAYLTALYSIRHGSNMDAQKVLRVIAVEEMLHLTIVANLINAIGGSPDLTKKGFVPNFPTYLPDGEDDFRVGLGAFTPEALEGFMKIERPGKVMENGKLVRRGYPRGVTAIASHPIHTDMHYYSIGDFYASIERGFRHLEKEAKAKGGTIFTGDPRRQVTSEYYYSGGGELFPVVDFKSAIAAMRLIAEQGEGEGGGIYDNERELAHYYRYEELAMGRYYQPGDEPTKPTGPTFDVDWDAVYAIRPNLKLADLQKGTELYDAVASFNRNYYGFLEMLTRCYNGEPELLLEAVPRMFELRNRMSELIRNPLPDGSGLHAMPTFEIDLVIDEIQSAKGGVAA